jgi:hypothetical protein
MRAFYPVLAAMELTAELGYTTDHSKNKQIGPPGATGGKFTVLAHRCLHDPHMQGSGGGLARACKVGGIPREPLPAPRDGACVARLVCSVVVCVRHGAALLQYLLLPYFPRNSLYCFELRDYLHCTFLIYSCQIFLRKRPDTVGQPPSKFEKYFFLCQFPQRFCLQRRHVGHTQFDTSGFANSIRPIFETSLYVIGVCKYGYIPQL